jgi:hypothetical protein
MAAVMIVPLTTMTNAKVMSPSQCSPGAEGARRLHCKAEGAVRVRLAVRKKKPWWPYITCGLLGHPLSKKLICK